MIYYQFSKEINQQFAKTLRHRVNDYFKTKSLKKSANSAMVIKTFIVSAIYGLPFLGIISGLITHPLAVLGLFVIMGFGKAFIGTSVMHDALHGSYTKSPWRMALLNIPVYMIGIDPAIWKIQHNVLHHSFTNIEHADEDIESRYIFRFTPNQPRRWFHQFQHLYAPLFYSLMTVIWVVAKDYIKLYGYSKQGLISGKKAIISRMLKIFVHKAIYLAISLGIPALVLPFSFLTVLGMYVLMHLVAGITLSLIFQPAHVMENCQFVETQDTSIEENWFVHQLYTTSNFAPTNRWLTWLIGSLNFQVEHHLFPGICHVHYPALSKIVRQTANEFNLPYNSQKSFRSALFHHFKMLRLLGAKDVVQPVQLQPKFA